jgi:hypothetical protein
MLAQSFLILCSKHWPSLGNRNRRSMKTSIRTVLVLSRLSCGPKRACGRDEFRMNCKAKWVCVGHAVVVQDCQPAGAAPEGQCCGVNKGARSICKGKWDLALCQWRHGGSDSGRAPSQLTRGACVVVSMSNMSRVTEEIGKMRKREEPKAVQLSSLLTGSSIPASKGMKNGYMGADADAELRQFSVCCREA